MAFLISLLMIFGQAWGQLPAWYPSSYGDLKVSIVPITSSIGQGCGSIDCDRMAYEVYLEATNIAGLPNGGDVLLRLNAMELSLMFQRYDAPASTLNEVITESCLSDVFPDLYTTFEVIPGDDQLILRMTNDEIEGAPDPLVDIPMETGRTALPVFTVHINAFPEETFGLMCQLFQFAANGVYYDGACNCTGCDDHFTFPYPMDTEANAVIYFGDILCDDPNAPFSEYAELPVFLDLKGAACSGGRMDFVIKLTNTAGFNGQLPEIIVQSGMPTPQYQIVTQADGYVVYVNYAPLPNMSGISCLGNNLFNLKIPKPSNLCSAYSLDAELVPGRFRGSLSGNVCKKLLANNTDEGCTEAGLTTTNDYKLVVLASETAQNCKTRTITAELDAVGQGNPVNFNVIDLLLDLDLGYGVTVTSVSLAGLTCPPGNNPLMCMNGQCAYVEDDNTVRVCLNSPTAVAVTLPLTLTITIDGPGGCVYGATIRKAVIKPASASTTMQPTSMMSGFPACQATISGIIADENGCYPDYNISVKLESQNAECGVSFAYANCNPYNQCVCNNGGIYKVTPSYNENPLDGVSTYDLALISKHILGAEYLDSPWKIIAADANRSKTITTFDIVEIRKLILGIYSNFPQATSWEFFDRDWQIPNSANPFLDPANPAGNTIDIYSLFGHINVDITDNIIDDEVDFVAVKKGDVSNSHLVCSAPCVENFPRLAPPQALRFEMEPVREGQFITVPVRATGDLTLQAWQLALQFDPEALELIAPAQGDLPDLTSESFNLNDAAAGSVRVLWFSTDGGQRVQPGQVLFYLTFKTRRRIDASDAELISLDPSWTVGNYAWGDDGGQAPLTAAVQWSAETRSAAQPVLWSATCTPNPTSGAVQFDFTLPHAQSIRLSVFDAWGNRVCFQETPCMEGLNHIDLPDAASWPAGVYRWELRHGIDKARAQGRLIKI